MTTTNVKVKFLTKAAIIAALYIVSTMLISPIAFGENQVRVSEALNILVFFTPAAIPGLFVGCILSNLASPFGLIDIACLLYTSYPAFKSFDLPEILT